MPSVEIAKFIELANLKLYEPLESPFDAFGPRLFARLSPPADRRHLSLEAKKVAADREFARISWVKKCKAIASKLPLSGQKYLGRPEDVRLFVQKYMNFWAARQILPLIAGRQWSVATHPRDANDFEEYKRSRNVQRDLPIGTVLSAQVDLVVNRDGVLRILPNEVLQTLNGVSADRIRSCAKCGQIFWASRIGSKIASRCCSTRCRKTFDKENERKAALMRLKISETRVPEPITPGHAAQSLRDMIVKTEDDLIGDLLASQKDHRAGRITNAELQRAKTKFDEGIQKRDGLTR